MNKIINRIFKAKEINKFDSGIEKNNITPHEPIFFVHIPKTAGTSFKKAALEFYSNDRVAKNYGVNSIETSSFIKHGFLNNNHLSDFYKDLGDNNIDLYLGHVHAQTARHIFQSKKIVTFLRNPISQVLSHYNHYKRWYGYKGEIEDFIETPGFKNVQSRYLKGMPLSLIGMVGITERYQQSIELYNDFYSAALANRSDNINNKKDISEVSDNFESMIERHNHDDMCLYKKAIKIFDQRYSLYKKGLPWVYGCIHRVNTSSNTLFGIAFKPGGITPVEVQLNYKGKILETSIANNFRPGFGHWNVPNFNHIGFQFRVPKNYSIDEITVSVTETGQELFFDLESF